MRIFSRAGRVAVVSALLAGALAAIGSLGAGPALAGPPQFQSNGSLLGPDPLQTVLWGELSLRTTTLGTVECKAVLNATVRNAEGRGLGQVESLVTSGCHDKLLEEPPYEGLCEVESCHPLKAFVSAEMPLREEARQAELCREASQSLSQCTAESERERRTVYTHLLRGESSLPWRLETAWGVYEEEEVVSLDLGANGGSCYPTERVVVEGKEAERAASWQSVPAGCLKLDLIIPELPYEAVFSGAQEAVFRNGFMNALNPSGLQFEVPGTLTESGEYNGRSLEGAGSLTGQLKLIGSESQLVTAR